MTTSARVFEPLDGKSPTLFLIAGGLMVVFAASTGLRVFTDASYPAVHNIFGPAGFFVGIIGLVGLYPALVNRVPVLARIAVIVAAIPAIGWFIITVFGIGSTVGVLPGMSVVFPPVFPIVVFLTTVLAYIVFGVSSLRSGGHSKTLSLVLFGPAVPFLALMVAVGSGAVASSGGAEFAIDIGHALAYLAVGVSLQNEAPPTERSEPVADSATGP